MATKPKCDFRVIHMRLRTNHNTIVRLVVIDSSPQRTYMCDSMRYRGYEIMSNPDPNPRCPICHKPMDQDGFHIQGRRKASA